MSQWMARLNSRAERKKGAGTIIIWMIFIFVILLYCMQLVFNTILLEARHEVDAALEASVFAAIINNRTVIESSIDLAGKAKNEDSIHSDIEIMEGPAYDDAVEYLKRNWPRNKLVTIDMSTFKLVVVNDATVWDKAKSKKVRVSVDVTYHPITIVQALDTGDHTINSYAQAVLGKRND